MKRLLITLGLMLSLTAFGNTYMGSFIGDGTQVTNNQAALSSLGAGALISKAQLQSAMGTSVTNYIAATNIAYLVTNSILLPNDGQIITNTSGALEIAVASFPIVIGQSGQSSATAGYWMECFGVCTNPIYNISYGQSVTVGIYANGTLLIPPGGVWCTTNITQGLGNSGSRATLQLAVLNTGGISSGGSSQSATYAGTATNLLNLQQVLFTNITTSYNTNVLYATDAGSYPYNTTNGSSYNLMAGGLPASFQNSGYSDPGTVAYTNLKNNKLVLLTTNSQDSIIGGVVAAPLGYDPQNDSDFYNSPGKFFAPVRWTQASGTNIAPLPYFNYGTNYTTNVTLVYIPIIPGISLTNQNTLYISPSGNDQSAVVGNPSFPFSTIYYASLVAPDNSTFIIEPGTYDVSYQTINFHDAIVFAYGATINYLAPDPYGTGQGVPFFGSGYFEWHGGFIYKTVIGNATIGYGDSTGTINPTNRFIVEDARIISPNGGGIQGRFPNADITQMDFTVKNNYIEGSWFLIELDQSTSSTNRTYYIEGNDLVCKDGPLSSASHRAIDFEADHKAAYVRNNTITISSTNAANLGVGIYCAGQSKTNTYVSGNIIDISKAAGAVTLIGGQYMIINGHPYNDSTISGTPVYVGMGITTNIQVTDTALGFVKTNTLYFTNGLMMGASSP